MLLICDTNILISGIFWGGAPGKIVNDIFNNRHHHLFCEDTILEFKNISERISKRKGVDFSFALEKMMRKSNLVANPIRSMTLCRDPKDQVFIDLLESSEAEFLITGDADLLVIREQKKLDNIRSVRQFLDCFDGLSN